MLTLIGGWLSRMCGGGPPRLPWGLDQHLYALPYGVLCFLIGGWIWALAAYIGAFTGKRTGHGGGLDMATSVKEPNEGRDLERIEYLIYPWLYNLVPRYWYDFAIMALTGLWVTLVPAIMFFFLGQWIWGVAFILAGLAKGLAYVIGWKLYPNGYGKGWKWMNESNAWGEFLTGVFGYVVLEIYILLHFFI